MGATKKRRQTKHRGNAAGMVESRGRTGARTEAASGAAKGGPRVPQPASWNRAFLKALIPVVILAPVLLFTNKEASPLAIVPLLLMAFILYVPLSYYTDRWVHQRYLKRGH